MRTALLAVLLLPACADKADDTGASDTGANCEAAAAFPTVTAAPENAAYPDPEVSARCDGDELVVTSNGIPGYAFVPITPNPLTAQAYEWRIPLAPERAAAPTDIPLLGLAAFTVTGLPVYGPNEGADPDPYGDPVYNEIVDGCGGHTGFNGDYHDHMLVVSCILSGTAAAAGAEGIIGYALDGFPIYGPEACADADCTSTIAVRSGWEQTGDPSTYAWDAHAYVGGDDPAVLDACNGRTEADGSYGYHATDTFPYVLGCYTGTPSDSAGEGDPGGGGGGGAPPGDEPADCADVPPGMPCCGDDVCDGIETAENCAVDCA